MAYSDFAWSPNSEHLVLSTYNRMTKTSDVYTVNRDGSELALVLEENAGAVGNLAWQMLPDASLPTLTPLPTLLPLTTFTPTPNVTRTPDVGSASGAILYSKDSAYYRFDLKTLTETQVDLPSSIIQISLHPDGRHFAASYQDGDHFKPILVNQADLTILPIPNINQAFNVSVSLDGTRIAYLADDPDIGVRRLWVANIDGTNIYPINDVSVMYSNTPSGRPAWSPDGTRIAYAIGERVRIIDLNTLSDQELFYAAHSPVWSPDGQNIAYVSTEHRTTMMYPRNQTVK